jgi:hypothetical protein
MRSWFRLILVGVALVAGAAITALVVGGGDKGGGPDPTVNAQQAANTTDAAPPPIQGLKVEVDGLIYNVTDVRVLDFDSPSAAPYLTNLQRPAKGNGFLGVFMRVYNPSGKAVASAPGFLLEPSKQPGLAEMNKASESPYSLTLGETVPANGVIPKPGSAAASGQFPGGLLLYGINTLTTDNQPLDLVVHTNKGTIAKLRLPPVPKLTGKVGHG